VLGRISLRTVPKSSAKSSPRRLHACQDRNLIRGSGFFLSGEGTSRRRTARAPRSTAAMTNTRKGPKFCRVNEQISKPIRRKRENHHENEMYSQNDCLAVRVAGTHSPSRQKLPSISRRRGRSRLTRPDENARDSCRKQE